MGGGSLCDDCRVGDLGENRQIAGAGAGAVCVDVEGGMSNQPIKMATAATVLYHLGISSVTSFRAVLPLEGDERYNKPSAR